MNAAFLPAVARPPHDPLTLVLDARLGWRGADLPGVSGGVEIAPEDGALAMAALPGSGRLLGEASGSFAGLTLPRHAAWLPDGRLVLLDGAQGRLHVLDACACRLRPWPCLAEGDVRVPPGASALALGCDGLMICVPHEHRVIVLEPGSGALRAVWHAPVGAPPWTPVHVLAVAGGLTAVADPARGGVHLCNRRGRALRFIGGLGAVRALAADLQGRMYVQREGADDVLIVELSSGRLIGRATRAAEVAHAFAAPRVAVHASGAIDIGPLCEPAAKEPRWVDGHGQILATLAADAAALYPPCAVWLSQALDSEIAACVWDRISLTASLPAGTRLCIASCTSESLLTEAELAEPARWQPAGQWSVPGSESDLHCATQDWMLHSGEGRYAWLRLELISTTRATPRVACLALDFPRVSLRRYLPALFGADPVATQFTDRWLAIFDRGLRDIESQIDEQARWFDPLAAPAVPEVSAREDFLQFIASWIGITLQASWPLARRRHFVARAARLYPWRGTLRGFGAALQLYLGLDRWTGFESAPAPCMRCVQRQRADTASRWRAPRLVLEHFTVRRWLALGHARLSDAAKLWGERIVNRSRLDADRTLEQGGGRGGAQLGATQLLTMQDPERDPFHVYAHRITVYVPAPCVARPEQLAALREFIDAEKPAHVQAELVAVHPRFRIGVQATLGLDAVVGVRTAELVLDQAALSRATVLRDGGTTSPQAPRGAGRMRVGMSTITY